MNEGYSCFQLWLPPASSAESPPWIEAKSLNKHDVRSKAPSRVQRDSAHVAAFTWFCPGRRQHFRARTQTPTAIHSTHTHRSLQHKSTGDREGCSGASTWQTDHTTPTAAKLYQPFLGRGVLRVLRVRDQDVSCGWPTAAVWFELWQRETTRIVHVK